MTSEEKIKEIFKKYRNNAKELSYKNEVSGATFKLKAIPMCELKVLELKITRLFEELGKENKKLKEIIKENFGYNEKNKECFFNYDGPVMEEEILEVINYEGKTKI